jgi:hypothetical protein
MKKKNLRPPEMINYFNEDNCIYNIDSDSDSYSDSDDKCKMSKHNDRRFECNKKHDCESMDYAINLCDKVEKRRDVYEWKIKKVQFLESTGMQKVCEPNKLIIKKVTVAGPTKELDITNIIKIGNNQIGNCPIDCVYIDTGKLNEYGNCDVEPGFRKIVEIEYMTDSCLQEKKKVCVIKDEVVDCGITKHSFFDKKKGKKRCHGCNKHPNHCLCIVVVSCKKCNKHECVCRPPCAKCNKYDCVCVHKTLCHKCNKHECVCRPPCAKCNKYDCVCVHKTLCHKCNKHECVCRPCPKVHMSNMLYIPLYPIATPYLCPNPKHCNKHCKCVGKCNC